MERVNGMEEYRKAQKLALKTMPFGFLNNEPKTYLPVLDEILENEKSEGEERLGTMEIPLELVIGTKTKGRTTAFASNFMPLLDSTSEFAMKWARLCQAQVDEGIHDPILCYEYRRKYYVQEGNKRVSVLKYFGCPFIHATVIRIYPKKEDTPESNVEYEYYKFTEYSHIYDVLFTHEGSYDKLLKLIGIPDETEWNDDQIMNFKAAFARFSKAFLSKRRASRLGLTVSDAFLAFITIYGYDQIQERLPNEISDDLPKIWEEFMMLNEEQTVSLVLEPGVTSEVPHENHVTDLLSNLFSSGKKKIGFVHSKTAATSSWTYSHELGRMYLEESLNDEIETCMVDDVTPENAEAVMESLIHDKGCSILFTTTPNLVEASLKIAVEHPDVKVLNCSLNMSHRYIRTYYARMYEAKFISGAIAGALTDTDNIGYIATYPIYGMTANINAFALGAKMTNPRAKVHLEWSCRKNQDIYESFRNKNISHISEMDMITPAVHNKSYGLIRLEKDGDNKTLATTLWDWGKLYEKIVQTILYGAWKKDSEGEGNRALNYWWGMSSDVIDVVLSREVPPDTRRLVGLLKKAISKGEFNPFSGILIAQNGEVISNSDESVLAPEDIIKMNWLNDNVIGSIPSKDELQEETLKLIELQGILE